MRFVLSIGVFAVACVSVAEAREASAPQAACLARISTQSGAAAIRQMAEAVDLPCPRYLSTTVIPPARSPRRT